MSRKWWIIAVVVVGVAGLGVAGWQFAGSPGSGTAQAMESMETAVVRRETLEVVVESTGVLEPNAQVALAFLSGGEVAEILVEEGQVVEAGQALVRLETDDLALQVARSEAALAVAEGQLAQLLAAPQLERVAAEEANLAAARGQVSAAVANRDQVTAGPDEAEIAAAEAQIAAAQLDHRLAVITYDRTEGDEDQVEQARYDLWAAEVGVDAAQKQLDELMAGSDADEVRAAQANVAAASAQQDAAQAQLDLLLAGAADEEIQAAEAAVDQARVALDQARLQLERATLSAPTAGTITALDVEAGEMAGPGQPVLVLSDLSALEAAVSLDETDVVQVAVGQAARVTLDAFPGLELPGEVTYVAPKAYISSGVVLYPVTVRLVAGDSLAGLADQGFAGDVRSGMTANVEIATASREDALIVPLRAVRVEGETAYVDRWLGDRSKPVEVELGLITDTEVEITAGLAEGDVVLVVPAASRDTDEWMPGPMRMLGGGS